VTVRTATVTVVLALALGVTLAGCSRDPAATDVTRSSSESTSTYSVESTLAPAGVTPGALPAAGSGGSSVSDIQAVDQQLDAMQDELDALSMPADSDFGSAEEALY
jgi:hypothetical protein